MWTNLVNFSIILFFFNFVKEEYTSIKTEGEEKCLNLKPGGKIA